MPRSLPSRSVADRSPPEDPDFETTPDEPEGGKSGANPGARAARKSAEKSAENPIPGNVPFRGGTDHRRGRGPQRGAANAGRPPSVIQALAREAWALRVAKLTALIDDPGTDPRVVVAAMAELRNGSGLNRVEVTGGERDVTIHVVRDDGPSPAVPTEPDCGRGLG